MTIRFSIFDPAIIAKFSVKNYNGNAFARVAVACAVSSVAERFVDIEEATGPIPVPRTEEV
jgi:hypothetical protein